MKSLLILIPLILLSGCSGPTISTNTNYYVISVKVVGDRAYLNLTPKLEFDRNQDTFDLFIPLSDTSKYPVGSKVKVTLSN